MTIIYSNICSALTPSAIGTRVLKETAFLKALLAAAANHDTSTDRIPGQSYIQIPESAHDTVSAGVGKRSQDPNDYVVRTHRGQVNLYLKREKATAVEGLAAIVYTREAYLKA